MYKIRSILKIIWILQIQIKNNFFLFLIIVLKYEINNGDCKKLFCAA